jgi:hypothetical protein
MFSNEVCTRIRSQDTKRCTEGNVLENVLNPPQHYRDGDGNEEYRAGMQPPRPILREHVGQYDCA